MNKKILLLGCLLVTMLIAVTVFWNLQPAIEIINPKGGTKITTYDSLNFKVKTRPLTRIGRIKLVRAENIDDTTPNDNWSAIANKTNTNLFTINFYKPGVYKIIAVGLVPYGFGEKISAQSSPITINVEGRLKWQTINVDDPSFSFSIQMPGEWIVQKQVNWNRKDPQNIKYVDFYFLNDGAKILTVTIYPKASWGNIPTDSQPRNILAQTQENVFTYDQVNTILPHYSFTSADVNEAVPKILQSFKAIK